MRVKAVITYDGSVFFGFQKQNSTTKTVSYSLNKALQSLQIQSEVVGSGRTDAGVHASGQVIHFDLPPYWQDLKKLRLNLNRKLKHISIKHISRVSPDFHARFSAKKRLYRYVFKTSKPSVFEENYISYYPAFNQDKLKEALSYFEGKHDFEYFRKTGSPTHTTIREIYKTQYKHYKNYHAIYFQANGFLRAQVRMMIEASMLYARGDLSLNALKEQINNIKKHTSTLATAQGLYLAKILY
jgi:tRNA pseudouridine38-40 synthase